MYHLKLRRIVGSGMLIVAAFATVGCTNRMLDFTTISSKNVNMPIPSAARSNVRVTGEDYVFVLLGIPLGSPNLKSAVDRAIESAGPGYDALVDGVVYSSTGLFKMGYKVEGTAVKTTTLKAAQVNLPVFYHTSLRVSTAPSLEQIGVREVSVGDGSPAQHK